MCLFEYMTHLSLTYQEYIMKSYDPKQLWLFNYMDSDYDIAGDFNWDDMQADAFEFSHEYNAYLDSLDDNE